MCTTFVVPAKEAVISESSKFGFRIQADLELRCRAIADQCSATTFHVHCCRHLTKVINASGDSAKAKVRATSKTSMVQHNATYTDLPKELVSKILTDAVDRMIIEDGAVEAVALAAA